MVTFETIAEKNQSLIRHAVPFLWNAFSGTEDTVKGDILYLFGISGDTKLIPKLETVLNGPYAAEVKEAAEEALGALNEKFLVFVRARNRKKVVRKPNPLLIEFLDKNISLPL